MWKPGDKRPRQPDIAIQGIPTDPNDREAPRRTNSLSGSTMNMRFMQRKATEVGSPASTSSLARNRIHQGVQGGASSGFCLATDADYQSLPMGRRSFNGFNRAVEITWMESTKKQSGKESSSSTISDEELLRRYKEYVRNGGTEKSPTPVGNLAKKENKRKRSSTRISNNV